MPKKLRNIWCLRCISIRLLISYSGELLQKGEKISKVTNFVDQKASKFPNSKYFWAVCSVSRRILVNSSRRKVVGGQCQWDTACTTKVGQICRQLSSSFVR